MRGPRRLAAVLAVALAGVLTAGGCGIPAESEPREVEPPPGNYVGQTAQPPGSEKPGAISVTLFMTRDGALVAVRRQVDREPSVSQVMESLLAGPTAAEQAEGISSALSGANLIGAVTLNDGRAQVDLTTGLEETNRSDIDLAIGQVVCTLDTRPEVSGVIFVHVGETIGVPKGDGALYRGTLTAADYSCPTTTA